MTNKLRAKTHLTWLAIALIAALVISACGANDEPTSSDTGDAATAVSSKSESIKSGESVAEVTAPTVEPTREPPAVPVTPKEVPEAGSIQEDILKLFEQQVRAMNTFNAQMYLDACIPGNIPSVEHTEYGWREVGGEYKFLIRGFNLAGFNARNVEFRVYNEDSVNTTFDMYDYGKWVADRVTRGWEKVDDQWYSTALSCTSETGRQ